MNEMRGRVKEHFPGVLLTLLGIVQALALGRFWSYLSETDRLFEVSGDAFISWLKILATFAGIVLVWVVYANNVMRFRWVPAISDSLYPFLVGLIEFMLIGALGPDKTGLWLVLMALTFAVMSWVSHSTMRRARQDDDNDAFFRSRKQAELRDFFPQIASVCALAAGGIYLLASRGGELVTMIALLATNALLAWQFYAASQFWNRSVNADAQQGSRS
ncbi:MAG: hypothetical protein GC190_11885 [Alphaproteobacteria bacterium]|nr:hypothetical protein [Alphaproteobacteria bacterium]